MVCRGQFSSFMEREFMEKFGDSSFSATVNIMTLFACEREWPGNLQHQREREILRLDAARDGMA